MMTSTFKRRVLLRTGASALAFAALATRPVSASGTKAMTDHKRQVVDLLKSSKRGTTRRSPTSTRTNTSSTIWLWATAWPEFMALFQSLPKGSTKVNTVRVFQDGEFVFTHTDYNFFGPESGFRHFPLREWEDRRALGQPARNRRAEFRAATR